MIPAVRGTRIRLRRGTLGDKAAVTAFTTKTFSWGDYLPGRWEHWVRSREGSLVVAELDGVIAGTLHVRFLGRGEAWLEGVRVRPEARGCGVATAMISRAHRIARAHKCHVIRLETSFSNLTAQKTFERCGYRRLFEVKGYLAKSARGSPENIRPAARADLRACWELWQSSRLKKQTRGIVMSNVGWRWWELTRARLRDRIDAGDIWVTPERGTPRGWLMLRQAQDLEMPILLGTPRAGEILQAAGRALAHKLGRPDIFWHVPDGTLPPRWKLGAGYTYDDDGMLIYECALSRA